MYLYFDKKGILKTKIDHGEVARQGSDLHVTVCFDSDFFEYLHSQNNELSGNYTNWTLTASTQKIGSMEIIADGLVFGSFQEQVFKKMYDSEITYSLRDGIIYLMSDCTIAASLSTNFGLPIQLNFMLGDITTYDNETSTMTTTPIASVTVEIEKTLGAVFRTNISPDLYNQLRQMLISNAAIVNGIESNYVKNISTNEGAITVVQNVNGEQQTLVIDDALIEVDDELSLTSENPVQNKVITEALRADKQFSLTYEVVDDE